MAPTFTPDRQSFRETVAVVAEKARAMLPASVNGRIESAAKLVLLGDVMPQADGTILVGSSSDPLKSYLLQGESCECQDFAHKAPDGWCQHRIAAGIHKRVEQVLAAQAPAPVALPEYIATTDTLPAVPAQAQAPLPCAPAPACPEALFSVTLKGKVGGQEALLTARGMTADEFTRNLEAIRGLLDPVPQPQAPALSQPGGQLTAPQHNAAAQYRPVSGFCPVHNVQMKENQKEGRTWYSHYDEAAGRWCKGK